MRSFFICASQVALTAIISTGVFASPSPTQVAIRDFSDNIQTLGQLAGVQRFAAEIRQLSSAIDNLDQAASEGSSLMGPFRVVENRYLELRASFHERYQDSQNRVLTVWYDSFLSFSQLKEVIANSGGGGAGRENREFRGKFEENNVFFSGTNARGLFDDCMNFMGNFTQNVDDVLINGMPGHKASGYWSKEALCAIAVLNSTPAFAGGIFELDARIEALPIALKTKKLSTMRQMIEEFVPTLADGVDDIIIGQRSFHKVSGYWPGTMLAMIFNYNIEPRESAYVARGLMETTPFVIGGDSRQEIKEDCMTFASTLLQSENVDDLDINGQHMHRTSGYYNAEEICMNVSSLSGSNSRKR